MNEPLEYRTRLLASFVHDLRTPLQVIEMNSRLLAKAVARGGETDELQRMIRDVAACSRRLTRMAQTTLELCSMESARNAVKPEPLAVGPAIEQHLRLLQIVADAVEVVLVSRIEAATPPAATVTERLWIVLDNLIFNALKHARRGTAVTVSVRPRGDSGPEAAKARMAEHEQKLFLRSDRLAGRPGSRYVEVSVHNHGPAISASRMATIFSEFDRDLQAGGDQVSTGLGLSIVEQCVHQLGGSVWVESAAVEGTTFFFTLPSELA
jgi:signal transduction histidine kinase